MTKVPGKKMCDEEICMREIGHKINLEVGLFMEVFLKFFFISQFEFEKYIFT